MFEHIIENFYEYYMYWFRFYQCNQSPTRSYAIQNLSYNTRNISRKSFYTRSNLLSFFLDGRMLAYSGMEHP